MFKNKKKDLQELVKTHARSETEVPTELEKIMLVEAEEIIKNRYDDLEGARVMSALINKKIKSKTLLQ